MGCFKFTTGYPPKSFNCCMISVTARYNSGSLKSFHPSPPKDKTPVHLHCNKIVTSPHLNDDYLNYACNESTVFNILIMHAVIKANFYSLDCYRIWSSLPLQITPGTRLVVDYTYKFCKAIKFHITLLTNFLPWAGQIKEALSCANASCLKFCIQTWISDKFVWQYEAEKSLNKLLQAENWEALCQ